MRLVASLLEIVNCVKPRAISRDTFGEWGLLERKFGSRGLHEIMA